MKPKDPLRPERLVEKFAALVTGYEEIINSNMQGTDEPNDYLTEVKDLLAGFCRTRSDWEKDQATKADDFNLLQIIEAAEDEATHSKILAWLLDRRLDHGTHAQGNLGFWLFLQELGSKLQPQSAEISSYHNKAYWVRREVNGIEARVDIEIAAKEEFIIHIENKIASLEGEDQTNREWRDLKRRAKDLGIAASNTHAIFSPSKAKKPLTIILCLFHGVA